MKNADALMAEAEEDIKLIVRNPRTQKLVYKEQQLVYTSMPAISRDENGKFLTEGKDGKKWQKFNYTRMEAELRESLKEKHYPKYDELSDKEQEKAASILDDKVDQELRKLLDAAEEDYYIIRDYIKNDPFVFTITQKNPGVKRISEGLKPGPAKGKMYDTLSELNKKVFITVAESDKTIYDSKNKEGAIFNTHKGFAYVKYNGRLELIHQRTLEETGDVQRVFDLLKYSATLRGTEKDVAAERKKVYAAIQSVMYFGYPVNKGDQISHPISFHDRGQTLRFGDTFITRDELVNESNPEAVAALKKFIGEKYHHVNKALLNKNAYTEYHIKDGKLAAKKTWPAKDGGYRAYLLHETDKRKAKGLVFLEDKDNPLEPQYWNPSLNFENSEFLSKIIAAEEELKEEELEEEDEDLEDEDLEEDEETDEEAEGLSESGLSKEEIDDFAMASKLGLVGDGSGKKKKGKKKKKSTKKASKVKSAEETQSKGLLSLAAEVEEGTETQSDDDFLSEMETAKEKDSGTGNLSSEDLGVGDELAFGDLERGVGIAGENEAPINMTKELAWFTKKFPGIDIRRVAGYINNRSMGMLRTNMQVLISELATEGTTLKII
jgi:hypothetical protein